MPGEVYPEDERYPERDDPIEALRKHFQGSERGRAQRADTGGGSAGAHGINRRIGISPSTIRGAQAGRELEERGLGGYQRPEQPAGPTGGSWLRADDPLPTRTTRSEPNVREESVQRLLNRFGYGIDEDGLFGPESMKALNRFVRDYLGVDLQFELGEEIPAEVLTALFQLAQQQ